MIRWYGSLIAIVIIKVFVFNQMLDKGPLKAVSSILSVPGVLLVSFSILFLLFGRIRFYFFAAMNCVLTLLMISHLLYIRQFEQPFAIFTFMQKDNLSDLTGSILSLFEWYDVIFVLDIALALILYKLLTSDRQVGKSNKPAFTYTFGAGVLLLCLFLTIHLVRGNSLQSMSTINFDRTISLAYMTPFGYALSDSLQTFKHRHRYELNDAEYAEILKQLKDRHNETLPVFHDSLLQNLKGFGKGKNVILIQVESLESFVLNQMWNGKELTPHLNKLLEHSIYFPSIYPLTMGGRSSDGELIVNTSLLPVKEGSTFFRFPDNKYPSLPDLLEREGYRTLALHGDSVSYWNREEAYPGLGYERFYGLGKGLKPDEEIGMGLSDGSFFDQTAQILKQETNPFMAFLITLTSHTPFELPDLLKDPALNAEDSTIESYFQAIHYTDRQIGRFIDQLEQSGIADQSLVVIYGDHEWIFHDKRKKILNNTAGLEWMDTGGTIPFIIYDPSLPNIQMSVTGGQIDIFPTLRYIMDLDDPYPFLRFGRNLMTTDESRPIIPDDSAFELSDLIIKSDFLEKLQKD